MTRSRGSVRATVAVALCVGLLASCSEGSPARDRSGPSPTSAVAPSRSTPAPPPRPRVPSAPATDNAARLARQLDRAFEILHARRSSAVLVRRAAEFDQLAVRALAHASAAFRRRAIGHLDRPGARRVVRSDAQAAGLLLSMASSPPPKLPDWRIVRPAPPRELLADYRRAQRRTGVHWSYLAAINLVETRMGRIRGVSTAGALGPMQFLPTTWDLYGAGGDIRDPADAILAAGRLLVAHGAPGNMVEAVYHYNPSSAYVGAVLSYARTIRRTPSTYLRYWHWRVLYGAARGTFVLPVGYPDKRPVLLPED